MSESLCVRLHLLSDLHLGNAGMPRPEADCDIVILAGDIGRPRQAMEWASEFSRPVLYVAGNHEFYGDSITGTLAQLRHYAAGTRVHILEKDEIILNGVRFLGTTLWTDFNLYGTAQAREQGIQQSLEFIRDFSRIRADNDPQGTMAPQQMEAMFQENRAWLKERLDETFDGPTVVITHHAPSPRSIHPRFEASLINTCFVSNSEDLMGGDRVALWMHGHTHDSFDYQVEGTRVLCNPRGYARDGLNENQHFNPGLTIELSTCKDRGVRLL